MERKHNPIVERYIFFKAGIFKTHSEMKTVQPGLWDFNEVREAYTLNLYLFATQAHLILSQASCLPDTSHLPVRLVSVLF